MGSGVMPLAMATRPCKAARDPAIPDISPGSRWSSAAPDTDPGPSPAGLVGGKRVVWVCVSSKGEVCRLVAGPRGQVYPGGDPGARGVVRLSVPQGSSRGAGSLAVLAAGRGV